MDEWMDGQMDGWMDGLMDGELVDSCCGFIGWWCRYIEGGNYI